jgi:hypothetical protein
VEEGCMMDENLCDGEKLEIEATPWMKYWVKRLKMDEKMVQFFLLNE